MDTLSRMNETDVREIIVRPLIQRLGYSPGTDNNVRTEVPLRYSARVLGHKKPARDHAMRGFADYVCEVVSYGRWTIEVKAPGVELDQEAWEQAFSYASHPEIAAAHFMLTNGRKFQIFSMLEPRVAVLEWDYGDENAHWVNIQNVLGPSQIRSRFAREQRHTGQALAIGLGASATLVGGWLEYAEYDSEDPNVSALLQQFTGTRASVERGQVCRDDAGLIRAHLVLAGPAAIWDEFNRAAGVEGYDFFTADEYISQDAERPTILQSLTTFGLPAGHSLRGLPGMPPDASPTIPAQRQRIHGSGWFPRWGYDARDVFNRLPIDFPSRNQTTDSRRH
jgi:hypothetical protein